MARFPTGRTAFVVIHGIGEQNPFDTLDGFGRGMLKLFDKQGIKYKLAHKLKRHGEGDGSWTESYLRLSPKTGTKSVIDLHEVYWAYLAENQISPGEMLRWLEDTLAGTRKFFADNQALIEKYEQADQIEKLKAMSRAMRRIAWVYPFIKLFLGTCKLFGGAWYAPLEKAIAEKLKFYLTEYLGDVAIYTTTDRKSKFFKLRQRILRDSLDMLKSVLNDPEVDRVVLCGHSLGSVIAYDTLNRLQIEASLTDAEDLPLKKLKGLVTFGSPLDKIAFFFREHAGKDQCLRGKILSHLHSFKSKPLDLKIRECDVADPVKQVLKELPWVNYWDKADPVSGKLHLYEIADEDNVELTLCEPWGVAHTHYWECVEMYEDVGERFLRIGSSK